MSIRDLLKAYLTEVGVSAVRAYVRFAPGGFAKKEAWEMADKYLLWRPNIARRNARTSFGCNIEVQPPDEVQTAIYMTGVWEPSITGYVLANLGLGDVFVDIGANVGYYTLLASGIVGSSGKVFAVEASPSIFSALKKNIGRNAAENVVAIHALASSSAGRRPFWSGQSNNLGGSTSVESLAERTGLRLEATVDAAPLPDLISLQQLRSARLIKIDVEGAELEVLSPLFGELASFGMSAEWIVELSSKYCAGGQDDVDKIYSAFTHAGYRAFSIPNSYSIDNYLTTVEQPVLRPLFEPPRTQADVLFSRYKTI